MVCLYHFGFLCRLSHSVNVVLLVLSAGLEILKLIVKKLLKIFIYLYYLNVKSLNINQML